MSTIRIGEHTLVGDLPADWELHPLRFPGATPGAVFRARITGHLHHQPGKMRRGYTYLELSPYHYAELEMWVTVTGEYGPDPRYLLPSGRKIWRKHSTDTPEFRTLP